MNSLYLISQTDNGRYDTYDSAIVCAESEDEARKIHPNGDEKDWFDRWPTWCTSPDLVTVRLIGIACPGIEKGVVLASFNAG